MGNRQPYEGGIFMPQRAIITRQTTTCPTTISAVNASCTR